MSTEIISGCGCCTENGRTTFCDLQYLFLKLYGQAKTVANLRGYVNYQTYLTIIIDNTGSITENEWDKGALSEFVTWLQNKIYINNPYIIRITNFVYNMEDWIYDCYRQAKVRTLTSDPNINIVMHTMDSSVHYNENYNYPVTTVNTDRSQPGNQITNHKQLYEYDCNIYNQLVESSQNSIISIGNIIGRGGYFTQPDPFTQVINPSSSLRPINTGGYEATLLLGGYACQCIPDQTGISLNGFGWQEIVSDLPTITASFKFEDSLNCGGSNNNIQTGDLTCSFQIVQTTTLEIKVYGNVETQSSGFDRSSLSIIDRTNSYGYVSHKVEITSYGEAGGCRMKYREDKKIIVLQPGSYDYVFSTNTKDDLFHIGMTHYFYIGIV